MVLQISYSLQLIKLVLDGLASAFTVEAGPTDVYNPKLQAQLLRSIHSHCYSWQCTGRISKIFNSFPWAVTLWWWWWLRQPNWVHYTMIGGKKWARKQRLEGVFGLLKVSACVLLSLAYACRAALLLLFYARTLAALRAQSNNCLSIDAP
ncbi:hypothetical protein JVU11DRAFT_10671 [Chiua virens]|nr:hypothetical protein JVU11DRAFT_10671 [Chiua virens]